MSDDEQDFMVEWRIVVGSPTPHAAAAQAWELMHDPASIATIMVVRPHGAEYPEHIFDMREPDDPELVRQLLHAEAPINEDRYVKWHREFTQAIAIPSGLDYVDPFALAEHVTSFLASMQWMNKDAYQAGKQHSERSPKSDDERREQ